MGGSTFLCMQLLLFFCEMRYCCQDVSSSLLLDKGHLYNYSIPNIVFLISKFGGGGLTETVLSAAACVDSI